MTDSNAHGADLSALKIDRSKKTKPPGRWKRWLHLLWVPVIIIGYFAYQASIREIRPSLKVRTATAYTITGSNATAELVATGYVVAQVKAAVASKATGRLRVLNVEEGDVVTKDEVLAELYNEDIKAQLAIAEANLSLSLADSIETELNLRRQIKLRESDYTTAEVVEAATAAFAKAAASVKASRAAVRAAEVDLEYTIIKAPFDGTVLTKNADVGEMVAPFASSASSRGAVVTIADMRSLEVEADVSESNIQKVKIGAPCEIILDAYPDVTYAGFVKKIVPTADRSRATVMVKVAFSNLDDKVLPEMSARVNFLPEKSGEDQYVEPVLVVDHGAITSRDGQTVAFVVDGEYVSQQAITIGRRMGDETEIVSGLSAGQTVVLSPPGGLKSGDKIEISQ
ncbi:MAG: efflux RND transporter periplasmic adaptor subunit [Candidatus Zixiibacteriota bacterium]